MWSLSLLRCSMTWVSFRSFKNPLKLETLDYKICLKLKFSAKVHKISPWTVWQETRAEYKSGQNPAKLNKLLCHEYRNLSPEEANVLHEESKKRRSRAEEAFIDKYLSIEDFKQLFLGDFEVVSRTVLSIEQDLIESKKYRQFYIDILLVKKARPRMTLSMSLVPEQRKIYLQLLELVSSILALLVFFNRTFS